MRNIRIPQVFTLILFFNKHKNKSFLIDILIQNTGYHTIFTENI